MPGPLTMPYVFDCDHPHDRPANEIAALIGGKAANLAIMASELGLPVPPAFTVSTQACREYLARGWPDGLDGELRQHMTRMEAHIGRHFGSGRDPLLVSVRSGAPVSMPGMMDTILNLGLNEATTAGLAAASGSTAFAENCRARVEQMYRDICGIEPPADPWLQLRGAIEAVFRSWNGDRARAYRRREGISDDLGTGVTVQAMVFGNRSDDSGTGVLFTRDPATGEPVLYGDVMFNAQGEDVVAGTHHTQPIAVLDERMPAVARLLREASERLERHYRDVCDIEFTIESGRLWLLQCRIGKRSPQAALRIARDMAQAPDFPLTRAEAVERVADILADPPRVTLERPPVAPIATGVAASPGIAGGPIVVSPEAALAASSTGQRAILVRVETSPDDVHGMAAASGILTATGGRASHAAVVARGWGIPAVVGVASLRVDDSGVSIDGQRFAVGTALTIDGSTGEVFAGLVAGDSVVAPEAAQLLEWARQLGIEVRPVDDTGQETPAGPERHQSDRESGTVDGSSINVGDLLVALLVKGYATAEALAIALTAADDDVRDAVRRALADGLAEESSGAVRLTSAGKLRAREIISDGQRTWSAEAAGAALDAFVALDRRMKATVTAWQLRDVGGEQLVNDHSDAQYDGAVLDELGRLHADAVAWLTGLAGAPSLRAYLVRLERAYAGCVAGDVRFVASPRVDSYHTVWFELHEELILRAGRTRSAETAAGRA